MFSGISYHLDLGPVLSIPFISAPLSGCNGRDALDDEDAGDV